MFICFRLWAHFTLTANILALFKAGRSIAISRDIIEITTSNSTRVKAFLCLCIYVAFFINIFVLCNTTVKSQVG